MLRLMGIDMSRGRGALGMLVLAVMASGCASSAPAGTEENRLAGCDRAAVQRWLEDSDLESWLIAERASGPIVELPDTEPDLSAQMKQELLDQCDGEVEVEIGPPAATD